MDGDVKGISSMVDGTKIVNLALQGGGAHGAFTWGVLDRLLEDNKLGFEAISGTSAGAMNAVVMADGYVRGEAEGARERLEEFWRAVSRESSYGISGSQRTVLDSLFGFWNVPSFPSFFMDFFSHFTSPYDFNPLNINPLKDILEDLVNFDNVNKCEAFRLYISATRVRDGKIEVFRNGKITADAVMASACLPYLFRAVEIGDEAYWDGGFMGNPALFPFFTETKTEDILLIQINPIERPDVPRKAHDIVERVSEITFNASLLREFRAIDFVNRLLDSHNIDSEKYKRNRLHRIDASEELSKFGASSKMDTSWRFFKELHDIGRKAAEDFFKTDYQYVGEKETLNLRKAFS
jgi:NTE family protein